MKTLKKMWNLFPLLILWLMLAVFFWSWIFTFLTDTDIENKITVYMDLEVTSGVQLSVLLEKTGAPGIEMVKIHPFRYALMSSHGIRNADLYIAGEDFPSQYEGWVRPLPDSMLNAGEILYDGDIPIGILVYDPECGASVLEEYLAFISPEGETMRYYLFFGANSVHVSGNENAVDDHASAYAQSFLNLTYEHR